MALEERERKNQDEILSLKRLLGTLAERDTTLSEQESRALKKICLPMDIKEAVLSAPPSIRRTQIYPVWTVPPPPTPAPFVPQMTSEMKSKLDKYLYCGGSPPHPRPNFPELVAFESPK
jgi:hypothetical protein